VLSVASISLGLTFFAILAHFKATCDKQFTGTMIEQSVAVILLALWAGGMPVFMNPDNYLAVSPGSVGRPTIYNANIYFGSWMSFAAIILICGSLFQEAAGKNIVGQTSPKTASWFGLMASSIVVLGSAVKFYRSTACDNNQSSDPCTRNKYALSLGVLGVVIGILMSFMTAKDKIALKFEVVVNVITLALYAFGVAYITFGNGPGTTIGNLYFSTWLGFILSVSLTSDCVREYWCARNSDAAVEGDSKDADAVDVKDAEVGEEVPEGPTEGMEAKA